MSDREAVFAAVRAALANRQQEPVSYPDWNEEMLLSVPARTGEPLETIFARKLEECGAGFVRGWGELDECLKSLCDGALGYADPALSVSAHLLNWSLSECFDRDRVDDYGFGITRASLGIAESGTLVLKGSDTASRLGALAPWVHVAVLQRSDLVLSISEALANLGDERNTVFVTGPSKTGDVEGILIKGVHGPGVQICCLVDTV